MKRAAATTAAAGVIGAVLAGWLATREAPTAPPTADMQHPPRPAAPGMPAPLAAVGPATGALAPRSAPAAVGPASLQGTEADGQWRADAQGRLVIDRALRRRLDYWLSSIGEWRADEIGTRVLAAARQELPATAAADLERLWQRYLDLQRHPWQRAARPGDPSTWRAALEERQSVRRLLLGREVADAFFADEEQALWRQVLAWEAGQPAVPPVLTPAVPEHPQAAQRVAEVEAQWAQWERRLAEARAEVARLSAARELSEPQRQAAVQAWLAQRFSASEQRRVRALLGVAEPAGA